MFHFLRGWLQVALLLAFLSSTTALADPMTPTRPLNSNAAVDRGADSRPAVAASGAGVVVAVWTSTDTLGGRIGADPDILFARSVDNGSSWSAPAAVSPLAATDTARDLRPTVETDGRGRWMIAWQSSAAEGAFDIVYAISSDDGRTWAEARRIDARAVAATSDDRDVRLASDKSGRWVATWFSSGMILAAMSADQGATFTNPWRVSLPGSFASAPTVASGEDRSWVIAWSSRPTVGGMLGIDADILFATSRDDGASWSLPEPLNSTAASDTGDDIEVDLASDGAGAWVAAWHTYEPMPWGPDGDILVSRSLDSARSWSRAQAVYSFSLIELGDEFDPRVATDHRGTWVLVWSREDSLPGSTDSDSDILQARSRDRGATWVGPELINGDALIDTGNDYSPAIATTRGGSWLVAWHSDETLGGVLGTDLDILYAFAGCGDGVLQLTEECDDGNTRAGDCCSGTCTLEAAGSVCRGALGPCDEPEVCNGVSGHCPTDRLAAAGKECRAAAGTCNPAEVCSGTSGQCPADRRSAPGTVCRPAQGSCDVEERCDGTADACAPDQVLAAGVSCRTAAGPCDRAEVCTGRGPACPNDAFLGPATECRSSRGDCDPAELCTGAASACPSDALATGTVCRPAQSACDVPERCTGSSDACPVDQALPDGSRCSDGRTCDGSEQCLRGACVSGTRLSCDDGNPCTAELCVEPGGCDRTPVPGCCLEATDCDDGDPCTADLCPEAGGSCLAVAVPGCCASDADCDDGNSCTADVCSGPGGRCRSSPITGCCAGNSDCAPTNGCAEASCDMETRRCVAEPTPGCCQADADCADKNACTLEHCAVDTGVCVTSSVANCCLTDGDCGDSDACTQDRCDGLTHLCTHNSVADCCAADADCNDGVACTDDRCDLVTHRCEAEHISGCCEQDSDCPVSSAQCGVSRCDVALRSCSLWPLEGCCLSDSDCDDGDGCTMDGCTNGLCQWSPVSDCVPGTADGGTGTSGDTGSQSSPDAGGSTVDAAGGQDAGVLPADATPAASEDAGASADATVTVDAGEGMPPAQLDEQAMRGRIEDDDGCECQAATTRRRSSQLFALLLVALVVFRRRGAWLFVASVLVATPAAGQPEGPALEASIASGSIIPAKDHELYDSRAVDHVELSRVGVDFALRTAFFPLSFIGAEVEGEFAPLRTASGESAYVFAGRGHAVLQLPLRLSPFVLAGAGLLGIQSGSGVVGSDVDPAFHFGVGVKYGLSDRLYVRVDGRQVISAGRGLEAGNTSHFSMLAGFGIVLWRGGGELAAPIEPESPREIMAPRAAVLAPDLPIPAGAEPEAASAPQQQVQAALDRVHFEWGRAEIRPQDLPSLDTAVGLMTSNPGLRLVIRGYADSTGSERFNLGLSWRRARSVQSYLVKRGIEESRIEAFGHGESSPVATNDTPQGRAVNRRIEFDVSDLGSLGGPRAEVQNRRAADHTPAIPPRTR